MNRGIAYGLAAYLLWGVLPVFWKLLSTVPPLEIVAHRIIWSFPMALILLVLTHRGSSTLALLSSWRVILTVALAALLLVTNWLVYIWGVNNDRIVETSLGYFMNPLVNVLLGVVFLQERLRRWQWVAIGIAALGVTWLTIQYGSLPWIALTLAFSFGFYGLLKKVSVLDPMQGVTAEMGILLLPMLALLAYFYVQPGGTASVTQSAVVGLLILTGVFTVGPLLLFGGAARLVPLSVLGLIQYIAPTLQFLIGIFVFREPFSYQLLIGFILIWVALGVYTLEGLVQRRRRSKRNFQVVPGTASIAT